MEPPECLAASTIVPVHIFPEVLSQPSGQEIPHEPEAHAWVCDCTREEGLLCGANSPPKSSSPRISCLNRKGLVDHVDGTCAQQLLMYACGVSYSVT